MGLQTPPGYTKYDPLNANHSRHVKPIKLQLYSTPIFPHYVKFHHNFKTNQHYVYGLHDDADPPTTPYCYMLMARPAQLELIQDGGLLDVGISCELGY
jgi:hypothetical protein